MPRNIKLTLSYDGTDFAGWQTQPDRRTVQETLETAIATLTQAPRVHLQASGRTDAGVHALAQVANFKIESAIPPENWPRALNSQLPNDVVIASAEEMPADFDANRDAVRKMYRYVIHDGATPSPFLRRYCCWSRHPLDARAMVEAATPLVGTHDFRSFETEWPNRATSVRTVTHLRVNRFGEWIWIDIEADGFLYNMVRAIAGTLMNVGRGFWPIEQAAKVLHAQDRTEAGPTAPASGLFLVRVQYRI
jgi:tRNA pseudouridine38-40 synthase